MKLPVAGFSCFSVIFLYINHCDGRRGRGRGLSMAIRLIAMDPGVVSMYH